MHPRAPSTARCFRSQSRRDRHTRSPTTPSSYWSTATTAPAPRALAAGKSTIRFEFAYDGGGMGKGGVGTLFVNDKKVGEGRIEHTQSIVFSADETADVGIDLATPVVEAIGSEASSRFTGSTPKVTIEVR